MSFEEFQNGSHGGHLGCWNGMNLAVLNLNVSTMPPTKFQLYQIYHSGADLISRSARWPSILELNRYSKKDKRKVQGVTQSQTTALPRPQEEEETDKSKQAQTKQTYEKH